MASAWNHRWLVPGLMMAHVATMAWLVTFRPSFLIDGVGVVPAHFWIDILATSQVLLLVTWGILTTMRPGMFWFPAIFVSAILMGTALWMKRPSLISEGANFGTYVEYKVAEWLVQLGIVAVPLVISRWRTRRLVRPLVANPNTAKPFQVSLEQLLVWTTLIAGFFGVRKILPITFQGAEKVGEIIFLIDDFTISIPLIALMVVYLLLSGDRAWWLFPLIAILIVCSQVIAFGDWIGWSRLLSDPQRFLEAERIIYLIPMTGILIILVSLTVVWVSGYRLVFQRQRSDLQT